MTVGRSSWGDSISVSTEGSLDPHGSPEKDEEEDENIKRTWRFKEIQDPFKFTKKALDLKVQGVTPKHKPPLKMKRVRNP